MRINKPSFKVFHEYDLSATLDSQLKSIGEQIRKDLELDSKVDYLSYIAEQEKKYKIAPLEFNETNISYKSCKEMIPAEYFRNSFLMNIDLNKSYEKEVLTFYLPFSGDKTLLRCVPSTRILWTEEVDIDGNNVLFDIINFNNNVEEINRDKDRLIKFLKQQSDNVNKQVKSFNEALNKKIEEMVAKTQKNISEHSNFLAELGVPVKSSSLISENIANASVPTKISDTKKQKFDVFICHASEDLDFVKELAEALKVNGFEVWYDGFQISWGDDLRPAIDNGLNNSSYGLVVFSKSFLRKKKWTEYELNGLFSREKLGKQVILPIWHDICREDIEKYSPSFADRIALKSDSVENIVKEMKKRLNKRV
ncbi:toll/interleukin-1 receptor domain-containing protein [Candidatus Dojkabacteria bacterium]|jgi:hypothetical protein|nr:toll/interleukin-1 receptor domain-containing protein [Candidatus Dojkabacteria bacterium]